MQRGNGITALHVRKNSETCASLKSHCYNTVVRTPQLTSLESVDNLPVPILEELKFFLNVDQLHSLSDVFDKRGVQTTDAWERLLFTKWRSSFWKYFHSISGNSKVNCEVSPHSIDPHQIYLTLTLRPIIEQVLEDERKGEKQYKTYCSSCLTKLSSYMNYVTNLRLSWKELCLILKSENPVVKNIKTWIRNMAELRIVNFMAKDTKMVANFLRDLTCKRLKSLSFSYPMPSYCGKEFLDFLNLVLVPKCKEEDNVANTDTTDSATDMQKAEVANVDNAEEKSENNEGFSHISGDPDSDNDIYASDVASSFADSLDYDDYDLYDEALVSRDIDDTSSEDSEEFDSEVIAVMDSVLLPYIRSEIHKNRLKVQEGDQKCKEIVLESLRFDFTKNDPKDIIKMGMSEVLFTKSNLNQWPLSPLAVPNLRRLAFNNIGWFDQVYDALVLVGTGQLTHLSLSFRQKEEVTTYSALLMILFEYFREGGCQPLKFLALESMDIHAVPSTEGYNYDIYAVEKLELVDFYLCDSRSLINLLRRNKVLTSLRLSSTVLEGSGAEPPLAIILNTVSNISTLETLILDDGYGSYELYTENNIDALQRGVLSVLRSSQGLKWLEINRCELEQSFVSGHEFMSAIAAHPSLEYLSVSNDKVGKAGADLLLGLAGPYSCRTLSGLSLEGSNMQMEDLVEAADFIYNTWNGKMFLRHLKLSGFKCNDIHLMRTVQRQLSSCVEFLDLLSFNNFTEIASFYEEEMPYF